MALDVDVVPMVASVSLKRAGTYGLWGGRGRYGVSAGTRWVIGPNRREWASDLSPNADLVFIDHSQTAGQIDVLKKQQRFLNRLADSVFGRWMDFRSHDTASVFRRKTNYISEVGIQRDEDSIVLNGEAKDAFVRGS